MTEFSSNLSEFFGAVGVLSSNEEGVFATAFELLNTAGEWAGAVAKLIGLVK